MNGRHDIFFAAVFVFMFGGLFDNVAVACKDRLLPDTFSVEELVDYENVTSYTYKKLFQARRSRKAGTCLHSPSKERF